MISTLISLVVLCLVLGLIYWLIMQLPIPEPFAGIIRVCVIVICILLVLGVLFGGVQLPHMVGLRL